MLIAGLAITVLVVVFLGDELFPESSPAQRGAKVAVEAGCFSCHGRGTDDGSPIPTIGGTEASFPSVPSLFEERHTLEELREWIEDGMSSEKRNSAAYQKALEDRAVRMPAFTDRLTKREIDDLVTFVVLVQYGNAASGSPAVSRGEELARRYACFTCHGELGQGGVCNPGSLKGYIPGFFGQDFRALTKNGERQAVLEWIENGASDSFLNRGLLGVYPGQFFTERQAIKMPAYRDVVVPEDIQILVDYVLELQAQGPLGAKALIDYRPLTGSIDRKARTSFNVASSEPIFLQVSSILETNCVKCHGPEKQRSGYRLDRFKEALQGGEIADFRETSAIIPGDSTQGLLLQFVQAKEEDPDNEIYPMPPGKNPRLAEAEIEILRAWIEQGAPWPERHQLKLPPQQTRP